MTSINRTDRLFITAISGGATVLSSCVSGMASIGDVYRHVKPKAATAKGVVTLYLRNGTQGWSQHHTFVLNTVTQSQHKESNNNIGFSYPSLCCTGF